MRRPAIADDECNQRETGAWQGPGMVGMLPAVTQ
jgi:hypothetical protein